MHDLARMFNGRAALVAGLVTFIIVFLLLAWATVVMYNDWRQKVWHHYFDIGEPIPNLSINNFSWAFWNSAVFAGAIGVFVGLLSSPEIEETNLRKNGKLRE